MPLILVQDSLRQVVIRGQLGRGCEWMLWSTSSKIGGIDIGVVW